MDVSYSDDRVKEYFDLLLSAWKSFRGSRDHGTAAVMTLQLVAAVVAGAITLAWLIGISNIDATPVQQWVHDTVGSHAGELFGDLVRRAALEWSSVLPVGGAALVGLGCVGLLMRHVQRSVNDAVGVETRPQGASDRASVVAKRLGGTLFVLLVAVGLAASFSGKIALEMLDHLGTGPVSRSPWLFRAIEVVLALALATILFGGMFRLLPDARLRIGRIWHAAFWAAKLYTLDQIVAAFAIIYVGGMSLYGEACVLLVGLGYFYFAMASFLVGVNVLRADLQRHGVEPDPSRWAVRWGPTTSPAA